MTAYCYPIVMKEIFLLLHLNICGMIQGEPGKPGPRGEAVSMKKNVINFTYFIFI